MPQKIRHGFKQMLEEAEAEIETLPAADAVALQGRDDTVLVDLRDPREREREGVIPGAFAVTRGMLEFWIDPESPYHKPVFAEDKRFVFFCAGGWRSALAAQTADAELQAHFAPLAKTLAASEQKIVDELKAVQGKPADIGGYYMPDAKKTATVMRPSATFNAALEAAAA